MLSSFRQLSAYQVLIDDLRQGKNILPLALPRAVRLAAGASIQEDLAVPVLYITDRTDRALVLQDELSFWSPKAFRLLFRAPNPLFYEQAAWGTNTRRERLQVLTALASYHIPGAAKPVLPPVIIAPARALMTRTLPRREFIKGSKQLKVGQSQPMDQLLRQWVDLGYQPEEIVIETGQFSRRGGIVDIWPPSEPLPVRVEFFGDEIDTLRSFDPASQRTVKAVQSLQVTPAREVLPGKAVEQGLETQGLTEFDLPRVHRFPSSLLDYLPPQALVLIDDWDLLRMRVTEIEEQAVKLRTESIHEGLLAEDFPVPYLSWSEIEDSLGAHRVVNLGRSGVEEAAAISQSFQGGPRFGGRLKAMMDYLADVAMAGEGAVVVSRQATRLKELWQEQVVDLPEDGSLPEFLEGTLSEGWTLVDDQQKHQYLFTDSEVFGWERPQPRQRARPVAETPEMAYADLRVGDWVVHVDYGIGRYEGLVRRTVEGVEREFLCIEYHGGDQVFVPVYQSDRLTRYIGQDATPPALSHLNGTDWTHTKEKVNEAVQQVADELLDLYARRQVAEGFSFQQDTPWQKELETSFPYIETEDQLRAINEVKRDMESTRPMDRLLCGDVGYGKTEVALRAAFKAVMNGRQVAVLVPTTVLAQQHYETFRQRLAAFPVQVEMLSRFRTAKEQDTILENLRTGKLDIIIGTHRLVQTDVAFKDLGLVIIDEEQRFGVTHKEHLKKLRAEVDVLTLTATPIPRTLYMALTGVRDISTINTPPEERLPIITHIGPYSPRLVRQAILRELERNGQVFFVHNRVQTIPAMLMHLKNLVPEAEIGIGHGQMHEHELADVMHRFTHGEIDVLLCTSIIESGLDIPNANTLIVDRADTFGLAQLYQLRGRVGRGSQRAYAYFFRHRRKPPTEEGLERLEVIAENTQLGAGYSIAMRDLEMRGAGELLGTRQHGYIAAVGFHLYTRLLGQAVVAQRKARGLPAQPVTAAVAQAQTAAMVNVELPLSAGIPLDYVSDQNMRLRLYRRLADLRSEVDLEAMRTEMADRFGPLPEGAANLFFQMQVKIMAEEKGLASVTVENDQLVLRYPALPEGSPPRNLPSLGPLARTGKTSYWLPYKAAPEDWRERLVNVLMLLPKG